MRRTHQLLASVAAAAVAGLLLGAVREGEPATSTEASVRVQHPVLLAGTQGGHVRTRDVSGASDADLVSGLASRLTSRRMAALQRIAEQGADASFRSHVEGLLGDSEPRTALWARGALFRMTGTPSLRVEICRTALANPGWEDAQRLVHLVVPETAAALLAAAGQQRAYAARGAVLPGLESAVMDWSGSGKADAVDLDRALAQVSGEALVAWLHVVRGLQPVPAEGLRTLARRLRTATPHDAGAIAKFFAAGPDLTLADDEVERALLAQAVASEPGRAGAWLLALVRLPRLSAEARERVAALRARSAEDAQDVDIALRARG